MNRDAVKAEQVTEGEASSREAAVSELVKGQMAPEVRPDKRFSVTAAMRDQVTIVIPTLNEEGCIGKVISELHQRGYRKILVVDGHSRDKTREVALESDAEVILQHGQGKSGALATGFEVVTTPLAIVMDGDGTYDPDVLDEMCRLGSRYDFVKGERRTDVHMSRVHRFGNFVLTSTFNLLFGTSIPDVCSGMYAIRSSLARTLNLGAYPSTPDQEILAQVVLHTAEVTSVPVNYRKRFAGSSRFSTWRQGLKNLWTNFGLARRYNPVLLFSFLSALVIIPATVVLGAAAYLYLAMGQFHGGYVLGSLMLYVIGLQGLVLATIDALLKRTERRIVSARTT